MPLRMPNLDANGHPTSDFFWGVCLSEYLLQHDRSVGRETCLVYLNAKNPLIEISIGCRPLLTLEVKYEL